VLLRNQLPIERLEVLSACTKAQANRKFPLRQFTDKPTSRRPAANEMPSLILADIQLLTKVNLEAVTVHRLSVNTSSLHTPHSYSSTGDSLGS
jgi:hypothetical protein